MQPVGAAHSCRCAYRRIGRDDETVTNRPAGAEVGHGLVGDQQRKLGFQVIGADPYTHSTGEISLHVDALRYPVATVLFDLHISQVQPPLGPVIPAPVKSCVQVVQFQQAFRRIHSHFTNVEHAIHDLRLVARPGR